MFWTFNSNKNPGGTWQLAQRMKPPIKWCWPACWWQWSVRYADGIAQYADGIAQFVGGNAEYVDGNAQYVDISNLDAHAALLEGGGPQLQGSPPLAQLGQVVDQSLKDVGRGCNQKRQQCSSRLANGQRANFLPDKPGKKRIFCTVVHMKTMTEIWHPPMEIPTGL